MKILTQKSNGQNPFEAGHKADIVGMFLSYNGIVESDKSCCLSPTIVASFLPSRKARVGKVLQNINISTILLVARNMLLLMPMIGMSYEMLRYSK